MTQIDLESWLEKATCRLSSDAATQVRTEIQQHYDAAVEAAILNGTSSEEVARMALACLGDAKAANREYRKVLLTKAEARVLRQLNWRLPVLCSRPWLRPSLALMTAAAFCASAIFYSPLLLALTLGLALFSAAIFLPVYTRARSRIYRAVKWIWLVGVLVVASWPDHRNFVWLVPCMWPIASNEMILSSVRRKLPVTAWPKQLYL